MQLDRQQLLVLGASAAAGVLGPLAYANEHPLLLTAFGVSLGGAVFTLLGRRGEPEGIADVRIDGLQQVQFVLSAERVKRGFLGIAGLDVLRAVHGDESHMSFQGYADTRRRYVYTSFKGEITPFAEQRLVVTVQDHGLKGVPTAFKPEVESARQLAHNSILIVMHSEERARPTVLYDAVRKACGHKGVDVEVEELMWISDRQHRVEGHIQFAFPSERQQGIFRRKCLPALLGLGDQWTIREQVGGDQSPVWNAQ